MRDEIQKHSVQEENQSITARIEVSELVNLMFPGDDYNKVTNRTTLLMIKNSIGLTIPSLVYEIEFNWFDSIPILASCVVLQRHLQCIKKTIQAHLGKIFSLQLFLLVSV